MDKFSGDKILTNLHLSEIHHVTYQMKAIMKENQKMHKHLKSIYLLAKTYPSEIFFMKLTYSFDTSISIFILALPLALT